MDAQVIKENYCGSLSAVNGRGRDYKAINYRVILRPLRIPNLSNEEMEGMEINVFTLSISSLMFVLGFLRILISVVSSKTPFRDEK